MRCSEGKWKTACFLHPILSSFILLPLLLLLLFFAHLFDLQLAHFVDFLSLPAFLFYYYFLCMSFFDSQRRRRACEIYVHFPVEFSPLYFFLCLSDVVMPANAAKLKLQLIYMHTNANVEIDRYFQRAEKRKIH